MLGSSVRLLVRRCNFLGNVTLRSFPNSRSYAADPKRFYKKTGVIACDGTYEITLDSRKLKTPKGEVLRVNSEPLALAIAVEWDSQHDEIQRSTMHLTSLCMTAQDNPRNINKYDAVQHILSFLETDTVLFYNSDEEELFKLQEKEWGPVIDWFCERFGVEIRPTKHIESPILPLEAKQVLEKYLLSYNLYAIHGFLFAVETLRSLILTLCCVERKLSIEQAVLLTKLEEEFQTDHWGRVEWAHDLSQLDAQSRTAAAVMFIHLNSLSEETKSKMVSVLSPPFHKVT